MTDINGAVVTTTCSGSEDDEVLLFIYFDNSSLVTYEAEVLPDLGAFASSVCLYGVKLLREWLFGDWTSLPHP